MLFGYISLQIISGSSCAPSAREHDRGGCNKLQRGNCDWPGCLPQWTRDWGCKLKDRIIEKIRIEIGGSTSKRAWSTNPAPFLFSVNSHPFSCLLSCSCLSISTVHGRIQYAASVSQRLTRLNQIQRPPSQELDIHLLNLSSRGSLETFLWLRVENGSEIIRLCWFWL